MRRLLRQTSIARKLWLLPLLGLLGLYPNMAMAQFQVSPQRYNIEQAFNYDATDCSSSGTAANPAATATGTAATKPGKVVLIGDSILNRTKDAIGQSFKANNATWNPVFDGLDSRKLDGTPPVPDGQAAIKNHLGDIQDATAVVVELGTNGTLTQDQVTKAIDTVRSGGYTGPIYWVNNVVVARPDYEKAMEANDTLLTTLAPQKNFAVIDWKGVVLPSNTGYIDSSDGVNAHPTGSGIGQFANLVVGAVAGGTSTAANSSTSDPCSTQCTSPGFSGGSTLPAAVPDPWRTLFSQAAAKFNVNPQMLAALFLDENGNVWKPFNSPWATSPAGAAGPFQFMPGTWSSNKQDGDGDGKEDINNMADATYAAANLVHNLGTDVSTPLGTLEQPFKSGTLLAAAAGYNWGSGNVQKVTNSPLSAAPTETQNYLKNTYALISSGFTKGGIASYGDPRLSGFQSNVDALAGTAPVGGVATTVCAGGTSINGIVSYFQTDPQWATHPYGSSNIKDSGCGPTTMAVISATLTGDTSITPIVTADIGTKNNDYIPNSGSSFKLFSDVTKQYHLTLGSDLGKNLESVTKALRAGHLLIASMHAGHFTTGGHIMVLRGITTDGKIQVVDVGESSAHHPKTDQDWDPQIIINEGDHFFEVTK